MITQQDGPSLAGQPATPAPAAQTTAPGAPAGSGPAPQAPGMDMFWILIPVLLGTILLSTFSAKKQRKQKEKMLSELRKHDRVVTTGGMIGFVAEVKPDVVVLKLEEGRDTRVTFTRDAIAAVVKRGGDEPSEKPEAAAS
ncbi:MAG: preprotein translocase subunit YajC [Phycisphaerales bacterium]